LKVVNFWTTAPAFGAYIGVTLFEFAKIFGIRKLEFLGYSGHCLHDHTFAFQ